MSRHPIQFTPAFFSCIFSSDKPAATSTRYYKRKNVVSADVMVGKSVINMLKMVRKSVDNLRRYTYNKDINRFIVRADVMKRRTDMQRFLMEGLVEWKNKNNRKPLILKGARQVGKTWLMKEFGKLHFENVRMCLFIIING